MSLDRFGLSLNWWGLSLHWWSGLKSLPSPGRNFTVSSKKCQVPITAGTFLYGIFAQSKTFLLVFITTVQKANLLFLKDFLSQCCMTLLNNMVMFYILIIWLPEPQRIDQLDATVQYEPVIHLFCNASGDCETQLQISVLDVHFNQCTYQFWKNRNAFIYFRWIIIGLNIN